MTQDDSRHRRRDVSLLILRWDCPICGCGERNGNCTQDCLPVCPRYDVASSVLCLRSLRDIANGDDRHTKEIAFILERSAICNDAASVLLELNPIEKAQGAAEYQVIRFRIDAGRIQSIAVRGCRLTMIGC